MTEERKAPESFVVAVFSGQRTRLVDLPAGEIAELARKYSDVLALPATASRVPAWSLVVDQPLNHDLGLAIDLLALVARTKGVSLPSPLTVADINEYFDLERSDLPEMPPGPDGDEEEAPDPTTGESSSTSG